MMYNNKAEVAIRYERAKQLLDTIVTIIERYGDDPSWRAIAIEEIQIAMIEQERRILARVREI